MVDEIQVGIRTNTKQLRAALSMIDKLNKKVKQLSSAQTKGKSIANQNSAATAALNKRLKNQTKALTSATSKTKSLQGAQKRLRASSKGVSKDLKGTGTAAKGATGSLGFTGLAFASVGAVAGFAGQQIRDGFISALNEVANFDAQISRVNLFSDTGIVDGKINLAGTEKQYKEVSRLANVFGLEINQVAELLKQVEKAAPASIDTKVLGEAIAGFQALENEVDPATIVKAFSTISANFPEESIANISDNLFAISKATKLDLNSSAKVLGFAATEAVRTNTSLKDTSTVLSALIAAAPGERGSAGRGASQLINTLTKGANLKLFQSMGIAVTDANGNFLDMYDLLKNISAAYKEINAESQVGASAFLETIGLPRNASRTLLGFANTTDEAFAAFEKQFDDAPGQFAISAAQQAKSAEAVLNKFNNLIFEVKRNLIIGVFPALNELNTLFRELFHDDEVITSLKLFGTTIGETIGGVAKIAIPILKAILHLFTLFPGLTQTMAVGIAGLTAVLTGLSIVLPIVGGYFTALFLHAKLTSRFAALGAQTDLLTKSYIRLYRVVARLNNIITKPFSKLKGKILPPVLRALASVKKAMLLAGAQAGATFSTAFNTISNAFIGGKKWIVKIARRMGTRMLALGASLGGIFGASFNAGSYILLNAKLIGSKLIAALTSRFAALGLSLGGVFGGSFAASNTIITGLRNIIAGMTAAYAAGGLASGGAFGTGFNFGAKLGTFLVAVRNLLIRVGILSAAGGAGSGGLFGGGFHLGAKLGTFLAAVKSLLVRVGILSAAGGLGSGGLFGLNFNIGAKLGLFLTNFKLLLSKLGIAAGIGGAKVGAAFGVGFATAIVIAVAGAVDFILETLSGSSFTKLLTAALFGGQGTSVRELFGLTSGDSLSIRGNKNDPKYADFFNNTGSSADSTNSAQSDAQVIPFVGTGGSPDQDFINALPGLQEEHIALFEEQIEALSGNTEQVDLTTAELESWNDTLGVSTDDLAYYNESLETGSDLLGTNSTFLDIGNKDRQLDNLFIRTHTELMGENLKQMSVGIVEIIRNFNATSALTSIIAEAAVMYANLIAQGNRAASALSSLKVSEDGVFSIRKPGISGVDQGRISRAKSAAFTAQSNQVFVEPVVNIEINPVITVENGGGESAGIIGDTITDELVNKLQERSGELNLNG